MYYFAYGSNLNWDHMHRLCPGAQFVAVARLDGYAFDFNSPTDHWPGGGVMDIIARPGETVWGVVYRVTPADLHALDGWEDYHGPGREDNHYEPLLCHVVKQDDPHYQIYCFAYTVTQKSSETLPPHPDYLKMILKGARHWGLPEDYITRLSQQPCHQPA